MQALSTVKSLEVPLNAEVKVADGTPCRKNRQRLDIVADTENDTEGTYSLKAAFRNLNEGPVDRGGEDDPTAECFPKNIVVWICEGEKG